jgi:hypothetical protein
VKPRREGGVRRKREDEEGREIEHMRGRDRDRDQETREKRKRKLVAQLMAFTVDALIGSGPLSGLVTEVTRCL